MSAAKRNSTGTLSAQPVLAASLEGRGNKTTEMAVDILADALSIIGMLEFYAETVGADFIAADRVRRIAKDTMIKIRSAQVLIKTAY